MTEESAGGVIVRKKNGVWQVLLIRDRKNHWTFPKGIIEHPEDPGQTAVREIREEVGIINVDMVAPLPTVRYYFYRRGRIRKTVRYFLFNMRGRKKPKVLKAEGISAFRWVTIAKARASIGYPKTNIPLLIEAKKILSAYGHSASS